MYLSPPSFLCSLSCFSPSHSSVVISKAKSPFFCWSQEKPLRFCHIVTYWNVTFTISVLHLWGSSRKSSLSLGVLLVFWLTVCLELKFILPLWCFGCPKTFHKTTKFLLFLWNVLDKNQKHSTFCSVHKNYVLSGLFSFQQTHTQFFTRFWSGFVLIDFINGSSVILQQKNVTSDPVVLCSLQSMEDTWKTKL